MSQEMEILKKVTFSNRLNKTVKVGVKLFRGPVLWEGWIGPGHEDFPESLEIYDFKVVFDRRSQCKFMTPEGVTVDPVWERATAVSVPKKETHHRQPVDGEVV